MPSADEDWDDEEWDDEEWDDDSDSGTKLIVLTNLRIAIGVSLVILLLVSSMIFTNFGFYSGAGTLSVLIDLEEGLNPEDRTLGAHILATSPTFGMLKTEGTYTISIDNTVVYSGKLILNDEGRGSIVLDYSNFFTVNGIYNLQVEIKGNKASDTVDIQKLADNVRGEVPVFDGSYPLGKNENVLVNLQFRTTDTVSDYISPWVTGTMLIYHAEEFFNEDEGEDYWNNDDNRNYEVVESITFIVEGSSINWEYSSGSIDAGVSLWLDPAEFYSEKGSGDYAIELEFTNDLGTDSSVKSGQTFWKWFHICETKANGECNGN